jgi:hypothetical protein
LLYYDIDIIYKLGTAPQTDYESYRNNLRKSPGPIYHYALKGDIGHQVKTFKVVWLIVVYD